MPGGWRANTNTPGAAELIDDTEGAKCRRAAPDGERNTLSHARP